MPFLYNCRHSGDQYRITKFDDAMNVESSYLTDGKACDCPAGERKTCRHREMLPKFIARQHIGDEWFLDFDRGGWVQMGMEWAKPDDGEALQDTRDDPEIPEGYAQEAIEAEAEFQAMAAEAKRFGPPKGVYIRRRI